MSTANTLAEFSRKLTAEGIGPALCFLNGGVPHRYTGVYQHADGIMRNIELADKEGEIRPDFLEAVPFEDSFCQFVLRDGVFRTTDSGEDDRLDGHKYKGVLLSYCGVPLDDGDGGLWGTLCHFDAEAWNISDEAFARLKGAAKVLTPHLPKAM